MSWLDKFIARIRGASSAEMPGSPESLPPQMVASLARNLQTTVPDEVSCEEVDRLMDTFAEIVARGEDASRIMPLVQLHFDHCPDCREELETLLVVMKAYQETAHTGGGG